MGKLSDFFSFVSFKKLFGIGGNSKMTETNNVRNRKNAIELEEAFSKKNFFKKFNKVWISGVIEEEFQYSHKVFETKYYKTRVKVKRLSGVEDYVPIIVSESHVANITGTSHKGKFANVLGRFTTHKSIGDDGGNHIEYFVSVENIDIYENEDELQERDVNLIFLEGVIREKPTFRTTPFGREITDLSVMVDRENYRGRDRIWCIAWEKLSDYVQKLKSGDRVRVYGRIQSREYIKKSSPDSEYGEIRTTYEVSVYRMIKVED